MAVTSGTQQGCLQKCVQFNIFMSDLKEVHCYQTCLGHQTGGNSGPAQGQGWSKGADSNSMKYNRTGAPPLQRQVERIGCYPEGGNLIATFQYMKGA